VEYVYWAAPVVAVLKSDCKSVQLCGDFCMTVNPVAKLYRHPISRVDNCLLPFREGRNLQSLT